MKRTIPCLLITIMMIASSGCAVTELPKTRASIPNPTTAAEGFRETDLLSFCGYEGMDLCELTMTAYFNDCEAGAFEVEPVLMAEDLMAMTVTGKKNSMHTTGNSVTYLFADAEGNYVASFEFYDGLLVQDDGMYNVDSSVLKPSINK